ACDNLMRFLYATQECEAGGPIAKCGRDVGLFTKYSSRPIQHLVKLPRAKIGDHVSHIPGPTRVQWVEPVSPLRVLNRFFDLTEKTMEDRPVTECQATVGIKSNGFLDEGNAGIHITAGQCKNEGCKRHYLRIARIESNRFLSDLD